MIIKLKIKLFLSLLFVSLSYAQSLQEIQRLKSEYEKFQKDQKAFELPTRDVLDVTVDETGIPKEAKITPLPFANSEEADNVIKHFGYDYFTKRDTVTFWENLPATPNYVLGPGDEIIISLWGQTQLRNTYTISREGKIYDDKVGLLNLSDKTMIEAEKYLKSQFSRLYATLTSKSPSTYIDISLGKLKSINVNFVGQVNFPGIYPIHPFSSIITGLIQAGGVDTTGSLRKIEIIRAGDKKITVDLYDYFINGALTSYVQLKDQDIVLIPPRKSFIKIDSAVVRPAIYESLDSETISDMINYAGGPTFDASENLSIRRIKSKDMQHEGSRYESFYTDLSSASTIQVQNSDHITIRYLFDEVSQVEVIGQVKVPGIYYYDDGMTLMELIKLSGGFKDTTYIKSIYLEKAEIIRRNPSSRYDQVISLNLNEYLNDSSKDFKLKNLDKVVVHANLNFFEKENILILGEVNIPGSYPITKDNESLESFIKRAGGLTSKSLKDGIEIYRYRKYFRTDISKFRLIDRSLESALDEKQVAGEDVLKDDFNVSTNLNEENNKRIRVAWQNNNISLLPGDSVVVKEKTSTILITGAIYNPGVLEYRKGKSLRYYINSAGGLTEQANRNGIIVLYANGIVSPKKWYSNPKILDGSTIIVNQKEFEEPFDVTQFATNWTSIISSMITAVVLAKQL